MTINQIKNKNQLLKFLSQADIEDFVISDDPNKDKSMITKFCNTSMQENRIVLIVRSKN